jgi:hypothetical protein
LKKGNQEIGKLPETLFLNKAIGCNATHALDKFQNFPITKFQNFISHGTQER